MAIKLGTHSSYTQAQANALTLTDLSQDALWFVRSRQSYAYNELDNEPAKGFELVTLADLHTAIDNAAKLTQQFPVVDKLVNAVAKSLFVDEDELIRAPEVAIVSTPEGDSAYLTGGRHRVYAIAEYVTLVTNLLPELSQKEREALLENSIGNTLVAVRETVAPDETHVVKMILADNQARKMSGIEQTHINAQANYGIKPGIYDAKAVTTILSGELKVSEKVALLTLQFYYFANKKLPKTLSLKENTLKTIGSTIVKFILAEENISKNGQTVQVVFDEFLKNFIEYVSDLDANLPADFELRSNVARHAGFIAVDVIGDVDTVDSIAFKAVDGEYLKKATPKRKASKAIAKTEELV